MGLIPGRDVIRPALLFLGSSVVIWIIARLVTRNIVRSATFTTVFLAVLFSFNFSYNLGKSVIPWERSDFGVFWLLVSLAVATLSAWKKSSEPSPAYLNIFAGALGIMTLFSLASNALNSTSSKEPQDNLVARHRKVSFKPDVFYIIADGYGRSDQLKSKIGIDNSDFINGLRSRGFFVANANHSNYCQTELSICSSLNMNYLEEVLQNIPDKDLSRETLSNLIADNKVAQNFKSFGYKYIAITSGFPALRFSSADRWLQAHREINLLEETLIAQSPVNLSSDILRNSVEAKRYNLASAFRNLDEVAVQSSSPRFIFVHLLAPHPAFVYNSDGTFRVSEASGTLYDGSDYMEHGGTPESYRIGYAEQLKWLNKELLRTVDVIRKENNEAIIVLQGDHGSKVGLNQNSLTKTDIDECFSNLFAIKSPVKLPDIQKDSTTPVNIFRIIQSELFDLRMPLLRDRSYYSTWNDPFVYNDVTNQLSSSKDLANFGDVARKNR